MGINLPQYAQAQTASTTTPTRAPIDQALTNLQDRIQDLTDVVGLLAQKIAPVTQQLPPQPATMSLPGSAIGTGACSPIGSLLTDHVAQLRDLAIRLHDLTSRVEL